MKISNETKVGALTAIAITILILGFNFLKGKNITETSNTIYAIFPSVEGLAASSPVLIKGFQVGRVSDLEARDNNLGYIIVSINLKKRINIPDNSFASLDKSFVTGTSSVKIELGNSGNFIKEGDTLRAVASADIFSEVKTALNPAMASINKTLISLDAVIQKLNSLIDPATQNNLQAIIANLHTTSLSLSRLLNDKNSALANSLQNAESITSNLQKNNGKIDSTLANVERLSSRLASAKIPETIESFKKTLDQLEKTMAKLNSKEGTMGMLLNDPKLYEEIRQTNRSLTILLDDFKTNPKRYVNVSVFGKKDKSKPLQTPIYDTVPKSGN